MSSDWEKADPAYTPRIHDKHANRLLGLLEQKLGKDPTCDLCGSTEWDVPAQLVALRMLGLAEDGNLFSNGANNAVAAMIVCVNCGNTKLLNVEVLGFLPIPDDDASR